MINKRNDHAVLGNVFLSAADLESLVLAGVPFESRHNEPNSLGSASLYLECQSIVFHSSSLRTTADFCAMSRVGISIPMIHVARHVFQSALLPALNALCRLLRKVFANVVYQDFLVFLKTDNVAELRLGVTGRRESRKGRNSRR